MSEDALHDRIVSAVRSRELHALYEYWKGKRPPGARLPGRAHIDPTELGGLLGNLILFEVEREPLRFRYRLTGSTLTARQGFDPIDTYLDQHPEPVFRQMAIGAMTAVAIEARPYAAPRDMFIDNRVRRYDMLALPLAADGRTVDMILVAMAYWD